MPNLGLLCHGPCVELLRGPLQAVDALALKLYHLSVAIAALAEQHGTLGQS